MDNDDNKPGPYKQFEEQMKKELQMRLASGQGIEPGTPLHNFMSAQWEQNARDADEIKKYMRNAWDNPGPKDLEKFYGPSTEAVYDKMQKERVNNPERWANILDMVRREKGVKTPFERP
jgi:hypothetical protein